MNFALYLIGYLLVSVGVLFALSRAPFLPDWATMAAGFVLAGIGLIAALTRSKGGDLADAETVQKGSAPSTGTPPPASGPSTY